MDDIGRPHPHIIVPTGATFESRAHNIPAAQVRRGGVPDGRDIGCLGDVPRSRVVEDVVQIGVSNQAKIPCLLAGMDQVRRFKVERDLGGDRRVRPDEQAKHQHDKAEPLGNRMRMPDPEFHRDGVGSQVVAAKCQVGPL